MVVSVTLSSFIIRVHVLDSILQLSEPHCSHTTSERTFSVLKRLLVYLRSTMTEKRPNNCLLVHVHKEIVDELDLKEIAVEFVSVNDERRKHFGKY